MNQFSIQPLTILRVRAQHRFIGHEQVQDLIARKTIHRGHQRNGNLTAIIFAASGPR